MKHKDDCITKFLLNFLIVGSSASVAKTILAPLDRIKLILQNQNSALHIVTGQRKRYANFYDCCVRIPKEQGFLSFWRGNGTNVIRYIPTQALNFSFNDFYKTRLQKCELISKHTEAYAYLCGGMAGASTIFVVYPLKFCQTRISLDMGSDSKHKTGVEREYNGLPDCFKKVLRSEGVLGMYRGISLAVSSSIIYRALYFGLFDSFKKMYNFKKNDGSDLQTKPPVLIELVLAQIATVTAGFCVYPFDTVGRRIVLEAGRKEELKVILGPRSGFKIIYFNEGIRSFYRGGLTNCLRAMCGALILVFYDEFAYYTEWKDRLSKTGV